MLELCIVNHENYDSIFKSKIFHKLDTICCISSQLHHIKGLKKTSLLIDYPYGLNSLKIREHEVLNGLRLGVDYLDITINPKSIATSDFKSILSELKTFQNMAKKNNTEIRPIIHTLNFNIDLITDLCSCFHTLGISTIVTGNGLYNTDINDDIINASLIQNKAGLQAIIFVPHYTEKTLELMKISNIYGIRVSSEKSLERILNKSQN